MSKGLLMMSENRQLEKKIDFSNKKKFKESIKAIKKKIKPRERESLIKEKEIARKKLKEVKDKEERRKLEMIANMSL